MLCRSLHFFRRRHLAGIDFFEGFRPASAVRAQFEIARELVQPQIALLLLRPMTADAMRLEKGFKWFRPEDGARQAQVGGEEQVNASN